jgi:peptidoglycan/LPS O-acetylase OafA/YrhL
MTFAIYVVIRHVPFDFLFPRLLAALVYLHGIIFREFSPIIIPSWSLEVEVQFYVFVPLLTLVFAIPGKLARRGTIVAVMLAAGAYATFHFSYWVGLPVFLQYFLAGFLLADLFLVDWKESPERGYRWDAIGMLGIILLVLLLHRNGYAVVAPGPLVSVASPFFIVMVSCGIFRGKVLNTVFTTPLVTAIGGMCYSIYLLHFILVNVAGRVTWQLSVGTPYHVHLIVQLVLMSLMILVVATIFFLFVEKPCMRSDWPQRVARRASNFRGGLDSLWRNPEQE